MIGGAPMTLILFLSAACSADNERAPGGLLGRWDAAVARGSPLPEPPVRRPTGRTRRARPGDGGARRGAETPSPSAAYSAAHEDRTVMIGGTPMVLILFFSAACAADTERAPGGPPGRWDPAVARGSP